jgi:hypothetical protein
MMNVEFKEMYMKLTLSKPDRRSVFSGLTSGLLQEYLNCFDVFCYVENYDKLNGAYNSCHNMYNFYALTTFGIGSGNRTAQESHDLLRAKLLEFAEINNWRIDCDNYPHYPHGCNKNQCAVHMIIRLSEI